MVFEVLCMKPWNIVVGLLTTLPRDSLLMVFATFVKELEFTFYSTDHSIAWRLEFVAEPMNFL